MVSRAQPIFPNAYKHMICIKEDREELYLLADVSHCIQANVSLVQ